MRKEFTNYLDDDILQDHLSMKNLVYKAGQAGIQQLLEDTQQMLMYGKEARNRKQEIESHYHTIPN